MLAEVMSPMPQRNRSNSGSGNIATLRKKLDKIAVGSRQRNPLIGQTRRRGAFAKQRPPYLSSGTSISRPTSENSRWKVANDYGSVTRRFIRASSYLVAVTFVLLLAVTV